MGGLSIFHWLIILVIVLMVMGPTRLPTLGKSLGEAIRGFKKGLDGDEIDVTNQRRENIQAGQTPPNPTAANSAANSGTNTTTPPGNKTEG
jgi:sec-independent protein translocase protein TatA